MHSPFSLSTLIPPEVLGSDAVTAILLHANRVFLGTEKGSLLVFDLSNASTSIAPPTATLVSKHEGFCKKPIEQLGVSKELNGLLCLSGGDLTLHSLPTLALLSSFASQSRGAASLFVLSTYIHQPPAAPPRRSNTNARATAAINVPQSSPEVRTTLALACRRKLVLLSWIDGAWQSPAEVSLPHQIRGMAFDERRIVAGFSTGEYGIVALPPAKAASGDVPTLGELFSLPLPVVEKPKVPAGGLGGLGNVMGLGALGGLSLGPKKLEKNGVVAVPRFGKGKGREESGKGKDGAGWLWGKEWGWEDDEPEAKEGEVFVVRENTAIPLTSSGKPRPSTSAPPSVVYPSLADETLVVSPYVVSLLAPPPIPAPGSTPSSSPIKPTLAIHSIDTLSAVQTLEVPPRPVSPPSSVAESSDLKLPDPSTQQHVSARLLTVASSSSQSPVLLLTSQPPPSTAAASVGEQTIWIATMKSWQSQIEELGQAGAWEEGIRLVRRSGANGGADLPSPLLRRLAILHSLALYNEHRYPLAIDAFISLDVSPAKVVALYPLPISGKLHVEQAGHEELFGGRPLHKVVAAREDQLVREEREEEERRRVEEEKKRTQPSSPAGKKGRTSIAGPVDDDDAGSIRSVAGRLKGKASWLRDSSDVLEGIADRTAADAERQAKLDAKNFSLAVDELIRYLTDRRQKYAQALAALLPSARPLPSSPRPRASGAELLKLPDEPLGSLRPEQLARVAQVVDTALFKAYLATKPVMVGPLCRIENWCEVEEVEELLLAAKKYRELLDLYNGKNMHEKAVKLLRQMADDEDDPEEKVGPTIRYLQKLGGDHVKVIFESSLWVFEVDRKAALEIYIADLEEVESLPRHATMAHLESIGADVCTTYLEHIIHTLGEEGSEFHEKLIELYLAAVHVPKGQNTEASDEAYQKLLDLLESSTSYRADRMLGRLPSEDMHEVRAILLGRLGRHEGALQIYVYQLEDHATAEEYCKRVYDSDPVMRPTIFHLLLRIYLRPRPSHPLLFAPALALISSHASSIDAIEVFELLPPLVALQDIRGFLEKTLRSGGEKRREVGVVRGVGRAGVDRLEEELVQLEERRVKITEGRVCPQCHKRIGNSVIAIHSPRGEVTHYQCREAFGEMNR